MKNEPHLVASRVWLWQGAAPASWHFVTIEKKEADIIKSDWHWPRKGFGSIPVQVKIGSTSWKTSVFPEKGGSYLLPLKRLVRDQENIKVGDTIKLKITVLS